MKKKSIIAIIVLTFVCVFLYGIFYINSFTAPNPEADFFKNTLEYPLDKVDINDDSSYALVKIFYDGFKAVTDTQAIKENVSAFKVYNKGKLYGTTPGGVFELYKDGELIDSVWFDDRYLTPMIKYGTLHFQEIDYQQYLLLTDQEAREPSYPK